MGYLLDSNVWIAVLRGNHPAIALRVKSLPPADVFLCSVVKAELLYGAHKSASPNANVALVERLVAVHPSPPFDDTAAEHFARIRVALEKRGTTIGVQDYLIAALALANGLTVVTRSTREFSRVSGLAVEDWHVP